MSLGLAMIVRDEAHVIWRCLASVREHIDYWTIVDTGSTDDTKIAVQTALDGIPGELHDRPWRDFGTNRTELLELAHGKTDWILTLDADATLATVGEYPDAAGGLVRYTGAVDWALPLLLRGNVSWRYVGKVHEYLIAVTAGAHVVEAPGWSVTHHGDGASDQTPGKQERYLEILLPDAEAGEPRAMFYVAQIAEEIGQKQKAIYWNTKRFQAGAAGHPEEQWVALLRASTLGGDRRGLLTCAEMRPHRAEPWFYLARLAADEQKWAEAQVLAEQGMTIRYPREDVLFVQRWIYEWGLRLERSAAAWWNGDHALCEADSLALLGVLPEWARANAEANLGMCR